jgi:class 3 adenylate cyclase
MAEIRKKSLRRPDETVQKAELDIDIVDIGDITVAREVHHPGWRWRTHVQPSVGGDWCQIRHVGVILSGRLGVQLPDGTSYEFGPDDVYEIPPGHDGYVIGHEPCVLIEWTGVRAFAGFVGTNDRALVTLLFTDLVGSSARAAELGDAAWRELLSSHYVSMRAKLDKYRGTEVSTTGDGIFATFAAPVQALRCAAEIRNTAADDGLHLRAAVHVGEVELVADDVRGVAVHEAERIMSLAGAGEILVSDTTRALAASGLSFEDRGVHTLKGLPGKRQLFAFVDGA